MRYSLLSVSLVLRPTPPTPGSHTPRALSFTSLHFSRFASQAGSRSADQRGKGGGGRCLSRIINYWPQAHAVPDRPGGEALCTEIPTLGKKKQVEDELFFFFTSSISECMAAHPWISLIIRIAGVGSQTSAWILGTFPGGELFPPEGAFGTLQCACVRPLSSHVKSLSETMCRACTRVKFSPMKHRCPLQPRPPRCHPGTVMLTVIGECVLCSSLLPPSLVSRALLLSGPSTRCP